VTPHAETSEYKCGEPFLFNGMEMQDPENHGEEAIIIANVQVPALLINS